MIGYVTLGTNDFEKATGFYDALAKELGGGRTMEFPNGVVWGRPDGGAMIGVLKPHDGKAATASNGGMTAFAASTKEQVERVHALALSLGGTCEGPPGQRGDGFYAAYFRDLDGNKLNAFYMG
jgi:catechol 2,3-dioxygenase-like lactoylglutathione lyase family enzyme